MFLTWILSSLNRNLLFCQDSPCVGCIQQLFLYSGFMRLVNVFLIRGFLVGERKNCKCTLPSTHFFLVPLFQQGDSQFKSVYFSLQFYSFAPLTIGPLETSVVPPTHQPRGLPNRFPSLGGDKENQQFSKSDVAEYFHSEKTKLLKETDFPTTSYFNLFQYHVGFFLSCFRVPRKILPIWGVFYSFQHC